MTSGGRLNAADNNRGLKRAGIAGVVVGVLALLACELPIVLAVIGLSGLGTSVAALRLPTVVELSAVIVAAAGVLLLALMTARRLLKHRQRREM